MIISEHITNNFIQISYELGATQNDRLYYEAVIETANTMGLQGKEITFIERLPLEVLRLHFIPSK